MSLASFHRQSIIHVPRFCFRFFLSSDISEKVNIVANLNRTRTFRYFYTNKTFKSQPIFQLPNLFVALNIRTEKIKRLKNETVAITSQRYRSKESVRKLCANICFDNYSYTLNQGKLFALLNCARSVAKKF